MTDITCRVCCMLKLREIVTEVLCLEQGDDGKLTKFKFPKRTLNWFTNCLAARTVSRVFLIFFSVKSGKILQCDYFTMRER